MFVKKATETIQNIYNNMALIEQVEDKYFDGMEIVNRELVKPYSVGNYLEKAKMFVKSHNEGVRNIETMFNRTCMGLWSYKLEGRVDFVLPTVFLPDLGWVKKVLEKIEVSIS